MRGVELMLAGVNVRIVRCGYRIRREVSGYLLTSEAWESMITIRRCCASHGCGIGLTVESREAMDELMS
jgi:hypothetical protein